jgi:hypothetical protein
MRRTLESLQDELIKSFEILDFKSGESFYFIKVNAVLKDDSRLHIKEYNSFESYLYSYHWQDQDGALRIRWDNAPHHKDLRTFPDHRHSPNLEGSREMSLDEVLAEIKERLQGPKSP